MFAAAQRPEAIRSLAMLEPAASTMTSSDAARDSSMLSAASGPKTAPTRYGSARFLEAVGTDMAALPADVLEEAAPLVPRFETAAPWDREPPVTELAAAPFPKLVVSGGHSEELAEQIDAARAVIEGAGHEIQFTGAPINDALLNLWAGAE